MNLDPNLLFAMGVVFIASFVQSTIGFGLAIVATPILFLLSADYLPAPVILLTMINSVITAYRYRRYIELAPLKLAIYGRVLGSILGAGLLVYVSRQLLSLWLGSIVLFAVLISLFPKRFEPTPKRMWIAGFFSGFMGTSSSIGGPPMALILQHQDANSLRGNMSAFFCFTCVISLIILSFFGYFHWHHVLLVLPLLPMVLLGNWISALVSDRISPPVIRYSTIIICLLSAFMAIREGIA